MVCLSRPYPFKFFKGFLPQTLLGPLLNTLSHMMIFPEQIEDIEENFPRLKISMAKLTSFPLQRLKTRRNSNSSQFFPSFYQKMLVSI